MIITQQEGEGTNTTAGLVRKLPDDFASKHPNADLPAHTIACDWHRWPDSARCTGAQPTRYCPAPCVVYYLLDAALCTCCLLVALLRFCCAVCFILCDTCYLLLCCVVH